MSRCDITIEIQAPDGARCMVPMNVADDLMRLSGSDESSFWCNNYSIEINDTSWDPDMLLEYTATTDVDHVIKATIAYGDKMQVTKLYYHGKYQLIDTDWFHEEYTVPAEYCSGPARQTLLPWSNAEFFSVDEMLPIPVVEDELFLVVSPGSDKIDLAHYEPRGGTWDVSFVVGYWKRIR